MKRLALLLCCAGPVLAAAPPPIEHFFNNPSFHSPQLSPDGKLLALISGSPGARDGLVVISLSDRKVHTAARFAKGDVSHFQWVNDRRLLFGMGNKELAQGQINSAPGLYAADYDGKNARQLAARDWNMPLSAGTSIASKMLPPNTYMLSQAGAQTTDTVYVSSPQRDNVDALRHVDLLELNTMTGAATPVQRPSGTQSWLLDHQGEPRVAISYKENTGTVHLRDAAGKAWKALHTFQTYGSTAGAFTPLAFGPDGTLFVQAWGGKDKSAVHTYDLATGKLSEDAVISAPDYDFDGTLIFRKDKLLGARLTTDATTNIWFDEEMKTLQADIDRRLPATNNLIALPKRPATPWALVTSYSDVQPHTYQLYNLETKQIEPIGAAHPAIQPAQMGQQEPVRYQARDGMRIPAWLTLPPGGKKKNLPLVVLVHGGPYVRGSSWGWSADVQFLASRGYAVLEPEFRGSTGYGQRHYQAGFKQWGLAMQNDIADGARWAVAQGYADPQRICIAGASYGGYATLMGLINDPDLYKCGINWIGVTDINLLYDGHWRMQDDMSAGWRQYGMPVMVGDQVKDAAQLAATSPLLHADKVTRPLLLAYGGVDQRVPLYHGEKFYQEVKKTNPAVEWVVYQDEGHGWTLPATRIDFWTRVEKFLEKNIGK